MRGVIRVGGFVRVRRGEGGVRDEEAAEEGLQGQEDEMEASA